jgi:hypothetical protein
MLAVYAIVNGNDKGWTSAQTLGLLGASVVLMALFLTIESRVRSPLVPLGIFRLRNVATSNVAGILWAAAMFSWFFMSALYLQKVLGYSPLKVGLAFLPANGKASALNLADNVVYTSTNQGCGSVPNAIWAIDTAAEGGTRIRSFPTNGGGVWGAGGVTIGLDGTIFAQVGDGPSDPIANKWSNTLLALSAKDLEMKQYFTPPSTPSAGKNVGLSAATPVAFAFKGRNVVLASAKDGRLYLLDGQLVGGEDHRTFLARTPVLSDGAAADRGVYAMSTYEDEQQTRWILAAVWGPLGAEVKVAGAQPAPTGSIVAFKVEEQGGVPAMTPAWVSRDMPAPAAPVISSGVVFALSAGEYTRTAKENWGGMYMVDERPKPLAHATLYALDGATGKEIYSSRNTITAPAALTGLSVANGRAYFGGTDGVLYCFGIPMER